MTRSERFRCARWRLGWLPLDAPLSYLLNLLPSIFLTKKVRKSIDAWLIRWPSICVILLGDGLSRSLPNP
ncbi:uncharacterized protein BX663DRAFT_570108 [Cokeromyces recurvatus]|uniref:uncharacterized protein n=1 Tax=Cokeromyces recurvatus TaxID=90255 RepID=UPI002220E432|nr:uncharacterized protein BX663DRAFT_570108 [Cokeromyces recurvatus]KAI7902463.1 hypothetical protein BX663DRAFT_570108 [Cokeromyces recurvatus]